MEQTNDLSTHLLDGQPETIPIESNIPTDGVYIESAKDTPNETIEKRPDLYDADGDGVEDDELFEGSTHSFAIYFETKGNVSGLIISYFVFIMQVILYLVCASDVMGDLSGSEFTIPVSVRYGKKCSEPANLVCPPDLPNLGYTALAAVLLAFFLMHDILAALRIYATVPGKWAKFAATIILGEAVLAAIIGVLFAVGSDSGYDAIANCIGVLFIHDADEKAFEAFQIINSSQIRENGCIRCCGKTHKLCKFECCKFVRLAAIFVTAFSIMVLALIVAGSIRGAMKTQIIEVYGDDYFSHKFNNGFYNWDWDGADTSFSWNSNV